MNEGARAHFRGEATLCWRNLTQLDAWEHEALSVRLERLGYMKGYPYLMREGLWNAVDKLVKMGDTEWVRENIR